APPGIHRKRGEWRRLNPTFLQFLDQGPRFRLGKPSADFSSKTQRVAIKVANEQCPEDARMLRLLGVAADDQLLFLDALGFEPRVRSSRAIRCVCTLRDDAFEPEAAGLAQYLIAGFGKVLAVKQPVWRSGHNLLKQRLALCQGPRAQIDAVKMQ